MKRVYIKSSWFSDGNNKYKKVGHEGFFLYLNLFRFRIYNQENDYTFITSISLLRKETGYTNQKIFDLLRILVKEKVIQLDISRWDRMLDKEGRILIDKVLIAEALDKPVFCRGENDNRDEVDVPKTKDDYYISLDMPLVQYYMDQGLSERYIGLYCLMSKYSNGTEGKSWVAINKMSDILGFGDKTVNSMIYELNRKYLLYSRYLKTDRKIINKDGDMEDGTKFEHFLLSNLGHRDQWLAAHKDAIDKNVRKWDKKSGI